jgi:hypothetical protein
VTMVDRLQEVIDRGCSSNCQGRPFVWTDEFQVYCCANEELCNTGRRSATTGGATFIITLVLLILSVII